MCKIQIHTHHNADKLQEIVLAAWSKMSLTEKDGYGAAWLSPSGKIQTIRSSLPRPSTSTAPWSKAFVSGSFTPSNGGYLIIHGRTSTCGVNVDNTHPFHIGKRALIHNGVVSSETINNVHSTCDSELLLHAWDQGGIASIEADIDGYYAFAVITEGRSPTLDIVKDSRANLHSAKIPGIQGWVFGTTRELALGDYEGEVHDNIWIQFKGGKHKSCDFFEPKKPQASRHLESQASKAFGSYIPTTNWRQELELNY